MSETHVYLTSNQLKIYLEALWCGNVDYGTYKKIKDRIVLDHIKHSEFVSSFYDLRSKYLESVSSTESETSKLEARTIEAYETLPEKI